MNAALADIAAPHSFKLMSTDEDTLSPSELILEANPLCSDSRERVFHPFDRARSHFFQCDTKKFSHMWKLLLNDLCCFS